MCQCGNQPDCAGDASGVPTTCVHLSIAYDGTRYAGWQIQPGNPTVQGELLKRLRLMLRLPDLKIYGSSRTDAGVHALDQQVSFNASFPDDVKPEDLARRLNRWLPEDIYVKSCRVCETPYMPGLTIAARHTPIRSCQDSSPIPSMSDTSGGHRTSWTSTR